MGVNLSDCQVEKPTFILSILAEDSERGRLASLGVYPGAEIKVIAKNASGLLVALGQGRLTLALAAAELIQVA
ncbi:MAG: ferrous iron transport protein A [Deltaproteobacteria bacterium]|jgi:Fe2+ transport system protein FeoA|nr:ferrous iron transport protein A [Deltaproteobacteria bacterium]